MPKSKRYQLITRSDMDGLVCGVILKTLDLIDRVAFVHPKDVQDGKVPVTASDITTNVPFVETAHLAFDHHHSETLRVSGAHPNHIIDAAADSAARVVYRYFGGRQALPSVSEPMLAAVDKADSARYTLEDVLLPSGWELLSFLMDPRTGLGRFRRFTVSNYDLMMRLIDHCRDHTIEEILDLPDVVERVELYFDHHDKFIAQLCRCTTRFGNVGVVDLREEDPIYAGNRFMVYALQPQINLSIHVLWGHERRNTVFAVGKSIFNTSSFVDIGTRMLARGGGGHPGAGTCQIPNDEAASVLAELIDELKDQPAARIAS